MIAAIHANAMSAAHTCSLHAESIAGGESQSADRGPELNDKDSYSRQSSPVRRRHGGRSGVADCNPPRFRPGEEVGADQA